MEKEKRIFSRVKFEQKVEFEKNGKKYKNVELQNISLKGAFLKLDNTADFKIEDRIKITIVLKEEEKLRIETEAIIIRVADNGIAVYFEKVDIDSFANLKRLIELNIGDEEIINKELTEYLKIKMK